MASEKFEQSISGKEIITGVVAVVELIQLFKNKGEEMKTVVARFSQNENSDKRESDIREKMRAWTEKINQVKEAKKNKTSQRNKSFFASLFGEK